MLGTGLAAALARNPSPKALMGGEAGTCRTGCRRLKGPRGPWLPARGTAPHAPFGLSPPGQQPAVIAQPLAARKRGTAGHWGQFLTVSEPLQLLLGRRQPPGGRHTQGPCSASTGTTSACGLLAPQQPSVGWLSLKHRNRSGIITLKGPRPGSGGISEEELGCVSA